ncbi:NAD(P)H-dependent oxidoreductase [Desulfosporosinus sp. BICA1-9]|uniref:NAD(P)H-dependent oxidoreductase n=1 Tax=Desulfosporosinus sp. BICA1-9 TaxID=1531958 RepID=UPI00054C27AB|nr:NAD(P)H-dependent oxidoreductase [Desulfosporosinus sp. BICA1-9]KJS48892.1 MAG: flavodoxin [Peptococcaceae bacterium BRH_c23]KJS87478.1 MAG: flavodoxin [Desulfosporosinus sp. BICA1-9]HBW36647.1 flavodoxin [Desulfosporosinus sp.]
MKNIVLISASPKINEQSVSKKFLDMAANRLDANAFNKTFIDVRKSIPNHQCEAFETLSKADVIIISFPLYFFCLPGILTQFLQDYYHYYTEHKVVSNKVKVFAIVNCGFPEPEINLEAVRVIKSFSQHINAEFCFGVLIGAGPMMFAAKDAPFMKKPIQKLQDAFSAIAENIKHEQVTRTDNIYISLNFLYYRCIFLFFGDRGWVTMARKNGLKKIELYRKPYC